MRCQSTDTFYAQLNAQTLPNSYGSLHLLHLAGRAEQLRPREALHSPS